MIVTVGTFIMLMIIRLVLWAVISIINLFILLSIKLSKKLIMLWLLLVKAAANAKLRIFSIYMIVMWPVGAFFGIIITSLTHPVSDLFAGNGIQMETDLSVGYDFLANRLSWLFESDGTFWFMSGVSSVIGKLDSDAKGGFVLFLCMFVIVVLILLFTLIVAIIFTWKISCIVMGINLVLMIVSKIRAKNFTSSDMMESVPSFGDKYTERLNNMDMKKNKIHFIKYPMLRRNSDI